MRPSLGLPMHGDQHVANPKDVPVLSAADLAMVLLVRADESRRAMPTVRFREIGTLIEELVRLGIQGVKVFASGDARDRNGSRGRAPDSLMACAIREIKSTHPSVIVMTETCLCSYTASGECHLTDQDGRPDLPASIEAIVEQAVAQAVAGADVVGPAAMLSGSVSCVRQALDDAGYPGVQIMPHLIFDSRLHDSYRQTMDAVPKSGESRIFQIDPAQPEVAVRVSLDFVNEGADMLLLEPALFCADMLVTLKQACAVQLAPFSVSGEYLKLRSEGDRLLIELFTMLKRSGADQIITYTAADIAKRLG